MSKVIYNSSFIKKLADDADFKIYRSSRVVKTADLGSGISDHFGIDSSLKSFGPAKESSLFLKLFSLSLLSTRFLTQWSQAERAVFEIILILLIIDGRERSYVCLRYDALSEEELNGISRSTFNNGIRNLIKRGVIENNALMGPSFYNFDVGLIYNGNRAKLIENYRKYAEDLKNNKPEPTISERLLRKKEVAELKKAKKLAVSTSVKKERKRAED